MASKSMGKVVTVSPASRSASPSLKPLKISVVAFPKIVGVNAEKSAAPAAKNTVATKAQARVDIYPISRRTVTQKFLGFRARNGVSLFLDIKYRHLSFTIDL